MKQYLVLFVYLCYVTSFNNGHTLSRIEINNTADVYEVNEGESTLTITHPKDDKTILREIVYFHVIEKPYDGQTKSPEINKRYFTNGHGYQYIDGNNDVIDDDKDTANEDDETEEEYDDEYGTEDEIENTASTADEGVNIDHDEKDDTKDENVSKDNVDDKDNNNNKDYDNTDKENKEIVETEPHINEDSDSLNDEAQQAQLASRRKRDLDYTNLPEPPKLPGFNWNILPDYIKAIILADQDDENDIKRFEDEIKEQVRELKMAANHPPSVDEREEDGEEREETLGNNLGIDGHGSDKEATYGMSLAGKSGKVWNNINSHHLHYVSETEALAKTIPTRVPMDVTTKAATDTDELTEAAYLKENESNKPSSNNLRHIESLEDAFKLFKEVIENNENEKVPIIITNDDDIKDSKKGENSESIKSKNGKKREVADNSLEDDKKEVQKREVKTYGMRLAGDSGVIWNAQPASRRKRDLDYTNLPEPPKLPGFNWNILPNYIKAIILADQDDKNDIKNFEDEIENQVRELKLAANHPPSVDEREDYGEERDGSTLGNNLDIHEQGGGNEATYGMSLAGNSGKVWNNINSHHLHYVSETEALAKTIPTRVPMDVTTKAAIDTDLKENDSNQPSSNNLRHIESLDDAFKLFKEIIENNENEKVPIIITNDDDMKDSNREEHSESIKSKNSKKREVAANSLEDDKKEVQKREAKTYGMRLAGDSGVVWNDVNTHFKYHIGEPESTSTLSDSDSTTKAPTNINKPHNDNDNKQSTDASDIDELKDIEDSLDQINRMLDELINKTNEANGNLTDKPTNNIPDDSKNSSKDKDSDEIKNIEDSFDEINKILEELINNNTNVTTESTGPENESTTVSTAEEDVTTESSTEMTTISDETDKPTTTAKPETERKHNGTAKHDEDSKQKQFVKELMKNKFFWQWLQDSSAAYLEVMMKKLDDLIKVEVDKQIKQFFDEHKNVTSCTPNSESQNKTSDKPNESKNATNTNVTTEKPTNNTTLEEFFNKNMTETNETSTHNPADVTETNSNLNNTLDNNTHSNKTENELERRNKSNDKDTPVKIDAHNVYGNSVGNGKVTNFFIFNINNESDLDRIKQLSNETNGVFVFGRENKTEMGKPNKNNNKNETNDVTVKPETNENIEGKKHENEKFNTAKPETVTKAPDLKPDKTVEDKQTTTQSIETTTTVNEDASTTDNIVESTTKTATESTDGTGTKSEHEVTAESPENNDNKPTDTSQTGDETQYQESENIINSTTENSKDNVSDGDSKDSDGENIDEKDKSIVTTSEDDAENRTEEDTNAENEIDLRST